MCRQLIIILRIYDNYNHWSCSTVVKIPNRSSSYFLVVFTHPIRWGRRWIKHGNKMRVALLITSVLLFLTCTNSVRILAIFPMLSHSHYTIGHTLMKELAKRGHEITFVSLFPEKEKVNNLTSVVLDGIQQKYQGMYLVMKVCSHIWSNTFTHMMLVLNCSEKSGRPLCANFIYCVECVWVF